MFTKLLHARIAAFERRYDYDMSYAREMLDANRSAFLKFSRASQIAREGAALPASAIFAAKLATSMAEDCGPCTPFRRQLFALSSRATSTIWIPTPD
jgi:hypothetical protein